MNPVRNAARGPYRAMTRDDHQDAKPTVKQRPDCHEESSEECNFIPEERCCCSALQRLASPYIFGVLVCLVNFFQAAASVGTGGGVLTTIEKRFRLKSSELAPFLIVNDIMSVVMVLFVAYYGHTSHRPRLIGGGGIIAGVGLLICTLPQFIYETPPQFSLGNPNRNGTTDDALYPICQTVENTSTVCTEEEERSSGSLMWQVSLIIVGQILVGLGSSPIAPLAVTYMDDSLDRTSTSVYVACMFIATSLGPLLGYGISGFSLSIHADFYKGPVYAQSGDPNWLGAWWLSYAIIGLLILVVCPPIVLFPKKIRRRVKDAAEMRSDEAAGEAEEEGSLTRTYKLNVKKAGEGKCQYVIGFLSAVRRLVTNLPFVTLVLGVCALLSSLTGSLVFMAKYLETQFGLSASSAPMLFGIMLTPGALFGNLIGGFVVKKLKLTKKGMARMVVIVKPVTFLLAPLFLLLGCNNLDIAGVTTGYPVTKAANSLPNLMSDCNTDCACPTEYTPICGSDGVTYVTPCHAGCLATTEGMLDAENTTVYTNCSCTGVSSQPNPLGLSGDYEHVAIPGECLRECNTLIPFVGTVMVHVLINCIAGNPGFMLQLRTVDDDDRSIAVGFTSMMLRLLGFIPSPIIFGAVIQTACLLLQSSCGQTGNCLVYDIVHFRYAFCGLTLGLELLATIMFALCYFLIRETKQSEDGGAIEMNEPDATNLSTVVPAPAAGNSDVACTEQEAGV